MQKKENLSISRYAPPPAASPSLRRAGLVETLSELGGHSFWGWVLFEHRLKHDLKVLATPCVQYKIWKAAEMTKRGRFPMLH